MESDSLIKECGCFYNIVDDFHQLSPVTVEALVQFPNHMSSLAQIYDDILCFGGVGIANKFDCGYY